MPSPIYNPIPHPLTILFLGLLGTCSAGVKSVALAGSEPGPDPFEFSWLGFNAGSSAFPGNPEPFERDPTAMTSADFNGDGLQDIAISNYEYAAPGGGTDGMSGFVVLLGMGGNRFTEPSHITVSSQGCWDIVAHDFDLDGDPDIAVSIANAFWEGTGVRIYLNDGSGQFPEFRSAAVANGASGLAAGDFDGDGSPDLAVASFQSFEEQGIVSILFGDGTGSLSALTPYSVAARPWKLESADMDGDGDTDLVVAHELHAVTVLENTGAGLFQSQEYSGFFPLQGGQAYAALALADGDQDGDLDVYYTNTRTGQPGLIQRYIVHLQNDGGILSRGTDIPAPSACDLISTDWNGDGWADFATVLHSGRDGDGPQIILSDGNGGYHEAAPVAAGQGTFAVLAVDIDGDTDPDLLTADRYSMALTVHDNRGDGIFPRLQIFDIEGLGVRLDAGDVDGDGDLDIMSSSESFGTPGSLIRNEGDGTFGPPEVYTHSDTYGRGVARAKLRDLDGDGDLDLLYNGAHTDFHDGYNFYTAMNDGAGQFGPIIQWFIGTCGNGDVDAFDLDGDGDLDVVNCEELACAGGPSANRLYISLNRGDGTFDPAYTVQISTGPHALLGGDFNEDGDVDLITTHYMPYGFRDFINVHIGNGDGTFVEEQVYQTGQGPRWIVSEDFDGDGHADLATANSGQDGEGRETMTVLFGTGLGTFTGRTDYYLPFSPDLLGATGLAAGDTDGDGDIDLMATTAANALVLYENDGTGSFEFEIRYGMIWGPWNPIFADFSGDGIEDVASIGWDGDSEAEGGGVLLLIGKRQDPANAPDPTPESYSSRIAEVRSAPNPSREFTRLELRIPESQDVDISVFDPSGRRSLEVHRGRLEAGTTHRFIIDARNLASGAYFVRITGERFHRTEKIVVQR